MTNKKRQKKSEGQAGRRAEDDIKSGEKKVPTTDPGKELDPRIHKKGSSKDSSDQLVSNSKP